MYSSVFLNPILALAAAAVLSAVLPWVVKPRVGGLVAIAGVIYSAVWALWFPIGDKGAASDQVLGLWAMAPGFHVQIAFTADRVATLFLIPLLSGVLIGLTYSTIRDLGGEDRGWQSYPLQLIALAGLLGILLGSNVVLVYAGWGVFMVSSYILLATFKRGPGYVSGAGAFLAIGSIAGLALLGAFMLLVRFGGGVLNWSEIPKSAFRGDFFWLFTLAVLAMAAQYPFHGLTSNAVARFRPHASLLVPLGTTMAALYLFLRVQLLSAPGSDFPLSGVLLFFGAVTAAGGAVLALSSGSPGAVAAFSNMSLSGFAVLSMGIGTATGTMATLFIVACFPFLVVSQLLGAKSVDDSAGEDGMDSSSDSRRVGFHRFLGLALLAVGLGMPFGAGFVVRWLVAVALLQAGSPAYAAVAVLASSLTLAAVARNTAGWIGLAGQARGRGWSVAALDILQAVLLALMVAAGFFPSILSGLFVERLEIAVLGGEESLITGGLMGLGVGGDFMYGFVGAACAALFLIGGIGLWYLRIRSAGTAPVFSGGTASTAFVAPRGGDVVLSTPVVDRFARIAERILEPEPLYRLCTVVWHRVTMPLRIIFYVVEERYYIGAVFLFVLGVFLIIMR